MCAPEKAALMARHEDGIMAVEVYGAALGTKVKYRAQEWFLNGHVNYALWYNDERPKTGLVAIEAKR